MGVHNPPLYGNIVQEMGVDIRQDSTVLLLISYKHVTDTQDNEGLPYSKDTVEEKSTEHTEGYVRPGIQRVEQLKLLCIDIHYLQEYTRHLTSVPVSILKNSQLSHLCMKAC